MKLLIISFIAALAVGTGAASGVAFARGKAAAVVAAAHADSVKAADTTLVKERIIEDPRDSSAKHDSLLAKHDTSAVKDTSKAALPSNIAAAPSAPVPAAAAAATPSKPVAGVPDTKQPQLAAKPAADTVPTLSEKRIAKAFATMPPKDAAKVFEVMSDADVSVILASLSDKESGAILAKLPPERVASLSKASLRGSHGGAK